MRVDDVIKTNKELPQNCRLNTEEGRQMAMLAVLTDISETLAIIADLYGIVHGRVISKSGGNNVEQ